MRIEDLRRSIDCGSAGVALVESIRELYPPCAAASPATACARRSRPSDGRSRSTSTRSPRGPASLNTVVVRSKWPLLRILRARHSCIPAQHREQRRSSRGQTAPGASRAVRRGRDPQLQTRRPRAAATRLTGPAGIRLTVRRLTHARPRRWPDSRIVSLASARQTGRNFAAENPFNATLAPWSSEILA